MYIKNFSGSGPRWLPGTVTRRWEKLFYEVSTEDDVAEREMDGAIEEEVERDLEGENEATGYGWHELPEPAEPAETEHASVEDKHRYPRRNRRPPNYFYCGSNALFRVGRDHHFGS